MKKISGFTLVELMISCSCLFFIVGICVKIYLQIHTNFKKEIELATLQENARLTIELLNNDFSLAGYIGCARYSADFPIINAIQYHFEPDTKIVFSQNSITVKHMSLAHTNLIQKNIANTELKVTPKPHLATDDIAIISDCKKAEIFKIAKVTFSKDHQTIYPTQPLSANFDKRAEIAKLEFNTYFINQPKLARGSSVKGVTIAKTSEYFSGMKNLSTGMYAPRASYAIVTPLTGPDTRAHSSLYIKNIHGHKTELTNDVKEIKLLNLDPHGFTYQITFYTSEKTSTWYSYVPFNT